MQGTKKPLESRTIKSALVAIVGGVMTIASIVWPDKVTDEAVDAVESAVPTLLGLLAAIFTLAGGLGSIKFRMDAKEEIDRRSRPGNLPPMLWLLPLLLPVFAAGCAPVRVSDATATTIGSAIDDLKADGPNCCDDLRTAYVAVDEVLAGKLAVGYENDLKIARSLLGEMITRCDAGELGDGYCEQYRADALQVLYRVREAMHELPPAENPEDAE